jgi:hypothetical protein
LKDPFFPYIRIPIRYILPDIHTQNIAASANKTKDSIICQAGGPKARRAGITIGEKSGKIEAQTANELFGTLMATNMIYNASITGIVIGNVRAWLSA